MFRSDFSLEIAFNVVVRATFRSHLMSWAENCVAMFTKFFQVIVSNVIQSKNKLKYQNTPSNAVKSTASSDVHGEFRATAEIPLNSLPRYFNRYGNMYQSSMLISQTVFFNGN